ncbi:MAG: type II toxin-antitoxin system YafQ family toxin [Campylobacter sputorum]|uniref:type II toxin-antitoxin system YafQ family toxin n=1 Tax=Campylobacter sputorum TaxID=206 RepID=UPI000B774CC1|nr:type II toxin-antitoxin system YafQ family toxin [Campylobacter sputorum]ASM37187.1 putative toxin-antitoxin system, toxin component, YafQ family [Campylobacter sputorum bv. faecalis CCUG 20703]ASM38853.1 putative toxin-antitoxin system, toxin component, YafQ family [Campylobacter sputorum bv. paraureolyticus LMG 11764]MDY6121092.1 type II toxin-antitoxin system YafQ family toxin [Campylobacter sputorum]
MPKYILETSSKFEKQYKKLSLDDKSKTKTIINKLLSGEKLEAKYKDHLLSGNFKNYRECHIKPDLLLIYKIDDKVSILSCIRVGSHSNLF